jgi:WD40 repeat protein/tRNA A-37 threonylcarbamoyl transferase component Bud32
MAQDRTCRECGLPLPEDALGGACPVCSLETALKFTPSPAPQEVPVVLEPGHMPTLEQGTLPCFDDYESIELIARGGMGVVYKARQTSLNRTVALKMIQGGALAGAAELKRFHAEAEAIAHLQHPNIVAIHEVGEYQGKHFFSMDYVAGRTLAEVARDGPLPATRAVTYIQIIAQAIHYAHEHGIIHRDLKPANIILDDQGQPHITDFGLAKRLSDSQASTRNPQIMLSGQVLGSPNYLPPEQADPKRGAPGAASDVYALGAILYHLVSGRPPFQAESITTLLRQVVETDPVPPRSLNPSISRDLETICLKCLAKEPRHRYATARALADDLGRFLNHEPVLARPVGACEKAWRWCRRQPVRAGLIGALFVTFLLGSLGVLLAWREAELRRRTALANEFLAQENAYAADMNLAQVELEKGDLGAAMALLNSHRPAAGHRDLRGWEWRYLWQRCRSDELFQLTGSAATVAQIAFASDSRQVVVRDDQATLGIWDLPSKRRVRSFKTAGQLEPFACSQQNNLLAYSIPEDRAVSIVSLETRQETARLSITTNLVGLAFSADTTRLFTLTQDGTFSGWDITSRQPLFTSKFPRDNFEPMNQHPAVSSHGSVAFRVGNDIALWEPDSGKEIQLRLPGAADYATVLKFSPDSKLLAAGLRESDGEVLVWAVNDLWQASGGTPPPKARFGGYQDRISHLAFSPGNRALVSAGADSGLQVWDMDHPEACRRYQGHRHQVLSVAWSPDGKRIISGGIDGTVRAWDPWRAPTPPGPRVLPATTQLFSFHISTDGERALTVDPTNGAVLVWDTVNLRLAQRLAFVGSNHTVAAWSPDGRTLATGDGLGNVQIWDLTSEREVAHMVVPGCVIGHFHFTHDGRFLACGAVRPGLPEERERLPKLWSVDGWREIPLPREASEKFLFGDFSPNSGHLVVLHWGGALDIWDIHSGQCQTRSSQPLAGPHELGIVWFSPNGRSWASLTQRGVLCLWNDAMKCPPLVIPRSAQELWNLGFSADGSRLLASGTRASDAVRLFDLANNRFVLTLSGSPDLYWRVGMSRDDSTVFAVGTQGVLIWRAPSWAEIEAAEKEAL